MKDIIEPVALDLADRRNISRDDWDQICTEKITMVQRDVSWYWKTLIIQGVLIKINGGKVCKVNHARIKELLPTYQGAEEEVAA